MTYNKERITDFEGKTVQYEWDSLNRRTATVYPDESKVGYKWDNTGRLASVVSGTGVTNYAYDAMGRISGRVLPDGTATKYELNPLGRLTSLTHSKDGGVLDQFKYSYDPAGNITQIDKHRAGIETDSGLFEYAYDPVGRLVSAMHDGNTKEYRYDSLGNRISSLQNGVETKHSYNARNQLIRSTEPEIEREYAYDKRGNLTSITKNGTLESRYDFDATNMMVAAFTEGKGKAEYSYNGFLKRVKRLETLQDTGMPDPTKELRYILDMMLPYDNLLMTQGSQNQSFVWGNELLMAEGEKPFGYLQDHLGSPVRLVGADVDEALAFDEFGVPLVGAGEKMHQPFGFTGYQTDNISGLYFAQARYYAPETSRMLSEDTHWHPGNMIFGDNSRRYRRLPDNNAIKESANLYVRCLNNPILYFDPDGERTYVAGGINPAIADDIGFNDFLDEMKKIDTTVPLPNPYVDYGSSAPGVIGSSAVGGAQVVGEMHGITNYSKELVDFILNDLKNNPLKEGEQLNLIGYSGGAQIVLNIDKLLNGQYEFDNIILIGGFKVIGFTNAKNLISIWSILDPLSRFILGAINEHVWMSHLGYFDRENGNLEKLLEIINKYINSGDCP